MSKFKIQGEAFFSTTKENFGISASNEEYTLNYSTDGIVFTPVEESTPSGENHLVIDAPTGIYWKCVGNNSELTISY